MVRKNTVKMGSSSDEEGVLTRYVPRDPMKGCEREGDLPLEQNTNHNTDGFVAGVR